jgi:hypothetical protein
MGAARKERIDLGLEKEQDSLDEIKLFIHGRIMCSMAAVWQMYGYQDYPAPEPPECAFKVHSGAQLKDFIRCGEITELQIYHNRPAALDALKYTDFLEKYDTSSKLPKYYEDNPNTENDVRNNQHYFKLHIDPIQAIQYVYRPVRKVKRCICIKMLYVTSGGIFYLRLILLNRKAHSDKDVLTYNPICGGGQPMVCTSYQQSAIAHGYVGSVTDVRLTFMDIVYKWHGSTMQKLFCSIIIEQLCNSCNI